MLVSTRASTQEEFHAADHHPNTAPVSIEVALQAARIYGLQRLVVVQKDQQAILLRGSVANEMKEFVVDRRTGRLTQKGLTVRFVPPPAARVPFVRDRTLTVDRKSLVRPPK